MKAISAELHPDLCRLLPETHQILAAANLVVHDAVSCVMLEGSRGLKGGFRQGSDVDLSLLVPSETLGAQKGFDGFVPDIGLDMKKVFPIFPLWSRV